MTNKQACAGLLGWLTAYSEALEAMRVGVSLEASQRLIKVTPALSAKAMAEAAEAISSLLKALDDAVVTMLAVRASALSPDWPESGRHFYDLCGETIKRCNAALNSDAPLSIGEGL